MESSGNAAVRDAWEAASERYLSVANDEFGWVHLSTPYLRSVAHLFEHRRVLDIGCGNGRLARVVGAVRSYLGIDWSPSMIEGAKAAGPSLNFQVGDAETLDGIGEQTFDVVAALNVFQNHEQPLKALERTASVLAEGGHLVVLIEHPFRTSAIHRAWPPEQVDEYARLGLDRAYNRTFQYRSFFLGEDTPIIGWHRPLSFYEEAFRLSGFDVVSFEELSLPASFSDAPVEEALKRGMIGTPVFVAFVLRKRV